MADIKECPACVCTTEWVVVHDLDCDFDPDAVSWRGINRRAEFASLVIDADRALR